MIALRLVSEAHAHIALQDTHLTVITILHRGAATRQLYTRTVLVVEGDRSSVSNFAGSRGLRRSLYLAYPEEDRVHKHDDHTEKYEFHDTSHVSFLLMEGLMSAKNPNIIYG